MGRDAELFVVVGQKGSGKTTTTLNKDLLLCLRGNPATGAKPRRVLIFDTQNEYPNVKTLPVNKIGLFSVHPQIEIRRILPFKDDGTEMTHEEKATVVLHIAQHYFNGCLVLEDINDYIFDYMPGDLVAKILSQRHKGVDVFLHYHSLGAVHKKIWRHINEIRIHKCEDNVIDNRDKFPEKFEMFKITENIIDNQFTKGNPYFYLTVRNQQRKIIANISAQERQEALEQYLAMFHKRLIQPYLNMHDRVGKKQFTYQQAWEKEMNRLNSTYFDN